MHLWTVQPQSVLDLIRRTGRYRCDPSSKEVFANDEELVEVRRAYRWMAEVMAERIGPPPKGVTLPVWAWHTLDGRRRPDLRASLYRSGHYLRWCLELEVPDYQVLLSDEELWHYPLNHWYLASDLNDEQAWEREHEEVDALPAAQREARILESWQRIFQLDDRSHPYVQATFWELTADMIQSARQIRWNMTPRF